MLTQINSVKSVKEKSSEVGTLWKAGLPEGPHEGNACIRVSLDEQPCPTFGLLNSTQGRFRKPSQDFFSVCQTLSEPQTPVLSAISLPPSCLLAPASIWANSYLLWSSVWRCFSFPIRMNGERGTWLWETFFWLCKWSGLWVEEHISTTQVSGLVLRPSQTSCSAVTHSTHSTHFLFT